MVLELRELAAGEERRHLEVASPDVVPEGARDDVRDGEERAREDAERHHHLEEGEAAGAAASPAGAAHSFTSTSPITTRARPVNGSTTTV